MTSSCVLSRGVGHPLLSRNLFCQDCAPRVGNSVYQRRRTGRFKMKGCQRAAGVCLTWAYLAQQESQGAPLSLVDYVPCDLHRPLGRPEVGRGTEVRRRRGLPNRHSPRDGGGKTDLIRLHGMHGVRPAFKGWTARRKRIFAEQHDRWTPIAVHLECSAGRFEDCWECCSSLT